MFDVKQKAQCVLWYEKFDHKPKLVRQRFRRVYRGTPPDPQCIRRWYKQFVENGTVQKQTGKGNHKAISPESVATIKEKFERSPQTSIRRAALEFSMPRATVWKILRKTLHLTPYKVQLHHRI